MVREHGRSKPFVKRSDCKRLRERREFFHPVFSMPEGFIRAAVAARSLRAFEMCSLLNLRNDNPWPGSCIPRSVQ
jgi:hypothetical protein